MKNLTMKKVLSMLLAFAMLAALTGCGGQADDGSSVEESTAAESTDTAEMSESDADAEDTTEAGSEAADGETGAGDGKTLVVYYSATGYTRTVAETIADATGGDLFELVPAEPYSDEDLDYMDDDSRVSVEYANPDERDVELVASSVDNWDEYDTVFIGYPIWWGIAAWPVDRFVKTNDFTDKTVIPFCTSSSSGLGESGKLLEEMAGTGNWQEGIRFRSSVPEEDVRTWTESLGFNR